MTCFWNAIISKLSIIHDITINRPKDMVSMLKEKSKIVIHYDVLWNDQILTDILIKENIEWISNYNLDTINNGHDCSICDPFLILISHIFIINIIHNYCGNIIKYTNINNLNGDILCFESNTNHFW